MTIKASNLQRKQSKLAEQALQREHCVRQAAGSVALQAGKESIIFTERKEITIDYCFVLKLHMEKPGLQRLAQRVRAHLAEHPGLILSTHTVAHRQLLTPVPEDMTPSSGL